MVERSRFCSLSSNVCHTDGKGDGIRWRMRTPDRKTGGSLISPDTTQYLPYYFWTRYLGLEMGCDRLLCGQQVDRARNIPHCLDDQQAGLWSADAFLSAYETKRECRNEYIHYNTIYDELRMIHRWRLHNWWRFISARVELAHLPMFCSLESQGAVLGNWLPKRGLCAPMRSSSIKRSYKRQEASGASESSREAVRGNQLPKKLRVFACTLRNRLYWYELN